MKTMIWIGVGVGGTIGGGLPYLWGNYNFLSLSSVILSAVGGIIGIWAGYQIAKFMGLS